MVALPTPAPTTAMPLMVGRLEMEEITGIHSGEGRRAMTRAELKEGPIEGPSGTFTLSASIEGDGDTGVRFPHSGKYKGCFFVHNGEGGQPMEVAEEGSHLEYERNSDGE